MVTDTNFKNTKIDSYARTFKIGDIIYPEKISKLFNVDKRLVYGSLYKKAQDKELKPIYVPRCPRCGQQDIDKRFMSTEELMHYSNINPDMKCNQCNCEYFLTLINSDVLFEKV